ncbi:MAG: TIGR00730 family Rossman fold protein [Pseudomonadota bacterium]
MTQAQAACVAVFCGANDGRQPHYVSAARKLGQALAERGVALVYGGSARGLMGALADAALAAGGSVTGIIPVGLEDTERTHRGLTRLERVADIAERKTRFHALADAYVALPGGIGTLDELFDVLTQRQLGNISAPVHALSVDGYFDPLVRLLTQQVAEGFMPAETLRTLSIDTDINTLIERLAPLPQ